jgi:hypothetical protein
MIKKLIACEGLILLAYILIVLFARAIENSPMNMFASPEALMFDKKVVLILYLTYPLYLLVRFIIWAIRTLKEK